MPARKPKALKREYADADEDEEDYDPAREEGDEITMKTVSYTHLTLPTTPYV